MREGKKILDILLAYSLPAVFALVFVMIVGMTLASGQGEEEQTAAVTEPESGSEKPSEAAAETAPAPAGEDQEVSEKLAQLSLEEKVAQLFIITPEALTGVEAVTASGPVTSEAYQQYPVGGLVYFGENLQAEEQVQGMLADMAAISREQIGLAPFLSVDEEGGRVARIAGSGNFAVEQTAPMLEIGDSNDPDRAFQAGAYIGGYLSDYGFNLNYAPLADVLDSRENQSIGDRSFGTDAQLVADMTAAAVQGFKSRGILTVLKHFPGHGAAAGDSHEGRTYNRKERAQLEAADFLPFKSGIAAGADMVMVGHISLPELIGAETPATLSAQVVTEMLREGLDYQGVVITDAMNMGAITEHYDAAGAAREAVKAGVDLILMPDDFQTAYQGLMQAVAAGEISEQRIDESVRRILRLKINLD